MDSRLFPDRDAARRNPPEADSRPGPQARTGAPSWTMTVAFPTVSKPTSIDMGTSGLAQLDIVAATGKRKKSFH
jgi:hypothetical protein